MAIRILIVEDEADSRDFLATLLELEGYLVSTAEDGAEALKQMETVRPDLILSDISMPNLDGVAMVKTLRSTPKNQSLPIIMMSAYGSEMLVNAIDAGANEAMRKPIHCELLLKNVKEWLGDALFARGKPRVRLAD
jgi:chemosensory pili system protein ChpA (sensor histidine kinase/response regulator)